MALQTDSDSKGFQNAPSFALADLNTGVDVAGDEPTSDEAPPAKSRRRARRVMAELSILAAVSTAMFRADNRAVADAVLKIASPALDHAALVRRVHNALVVEDDDGCVSFGVRCLVLGVLDGTPPHVAKPSVLANAVAASSWLEITTNDVRAMLVARTATMAARHACGVERGLAEQLCGLAVHDPALAHAIVQDEDILDELRDMALWLQHNPSNPGANANQHLSNLLYDLGLARRGSAPAKTIEAARMMARRGLSKVDRICGGLFSSPAHRLYDRVAFESP